MKRYATMSRAELIKALAAAEHKGLLARAAGDAGGSRARKPRRPAAVPREHNGERAGPHHDGPTRPDDLAQLYEQAPAACLTLSQHGLILRVNRAGARLLGVEPARLIGQPLGAFLAPGAGQSFARQLQVSRRKQTAAAGEFLFADQVPGGPRQVQVFSQPVRVAGARGVIFETVLLEGAAQRRADAAGSEAEERFRQLADNLTAVCCVTDPAFRTVFYVNPAYETVWGRTPASLCAAPSQWREAIHPEDRARIVAPAAQSPVQEQEEEYRIVRPDGTTRWIHERVIPLKHPPGRGHRLARLAEDITERRKLEAQVSETQSGFRQFAENIREVFWMTDLKTGRMIYLSPGYQKLWGRTSRYQSPREWLAHVVPEDRERVWEAAQTKQLTGEYSLVYRLRRPDGAIRWVHERAFPVRDESGEAVRVAGIADDITEHKLIEKELLEISDREQCRFGQDLHDGLCQHLAGLEYLTQSLKASLADKGHAEADQAAQIATLIGQASALAHDLARGLSPVPLEAAGLRSALQELAATTERLFHVRCELRADATVLIHDNGVATHLYRIAQEAVGNAIKHGKARRIVLGLTRDRHWTVLSIMNDGAELPEQPPRGAGLGGRIMNFRASMIGGVLERKLGPDRQPIVVCSVPTLPARSPTRNT